MSDSQTSVGTRHIPMWLLAELTYACPQQCPYCSNPLQLPDSRTRELSTGEWLRVFRQARRLGAVQLGLSGGEPLVRRDVEELVREAVGMGFYCNLITSAVGLTRDRIGAFREAGLNHIQISFQGADRESNARFGGSDSFDHKLAMTEEVVRQGIPCGINFVLHRGNIHQVEDFLVLAQSLGAEFVELANTQYYAWALHNRDGLLPTLAQVRAAEEATERFRQSQETAMRIFFVAPDYYEGRPKKCSNGWGTTFLSINPYGEALPCQGAKVIPGLDFPSVREMSLDDIWHGSDAFNRFRGTAWMKPPCASCPERERDAGGCRCQAYLLTGDPANTDPVCGLSPHHSVIERAVRIAAEQEWPRDLVFRNPANARRIASAKGGDQP